MGRVGGFRRQRPSARPGESMMMRGPMAGRAEMPDPARMMAREMPTTNTAPQPMMTPDEAIAKMRGGIR